MQFRILGPVEVIDGGVPVAVGGPQQRALLAVLLMNPNRVVSADRLVEDLWGDEPPPDARGLLRGCVARLRRALRHDRPAAPDPLVTRPPGYLLTVAPGALDAHRVDELEAAAHRALAENSQAARERAAGLLREALGLWRGPALDDLTIGSCRAYAARLEERRLALLEQRIDVDLWLGRHADLAGELGGHVRAEPLRERLWAQLMLALCGADRRAEALAAFRRLRQLLVDELGMEPSPTLQDLERAILTGADAFAVYRQAYGVAGDAVPAGDRTRGGHAPERSGEPGAAPPPAVAQTGDTGGAAGGAAVGGAGAADPTHAWPGGGATPPGGAWPAATAPGGSGGTAADGTTAPGGSAAAPDGTTAPGGGAARPGRHDAGPAHPGTAPRRRRRVRRAGAQPRPAGRRTRRHRTRRHRT